MSINHGNRIASDFKPDGSRAGQLHDLRRHRQQTNALQEFSRATRKCSFTPRRRCCQGSLETVGQLDYHRPRAGITRSEPTRPSHYWKPGCRPSEGSTCAGPRVCSHLRFCCQLVDMNVTC